MKALYTLVIVLFTSTLLSGELSICQDLAKKYDAVTEYRLDDNTRVDLLSKEYAIEVDYAHKFYESVGQATYYAIKTGRKPAIILLIKDESEQKYIDRCRKICENVEVTVIQDNKPVKYKIQLFVESLLPYMIKAER
jgi:hypothetical protein